ncbi:helix-turn-helix domain-containing protein [Priestia megaterium]
MGRKLTTKQVQTIRELYTSGKTYSEIKEALNLQLSNTTIVKYTRGLARQHPSQLTEEQIQVVRRMYRKGRTYEQIREITNASVRTILKYTKGIKRTGKRKYTYNPPVFKRNCDHCGKYYEGHRRRYCSHECYYEVNKENAVKRSQELRH